MYCNVEDWEDQEELLVRTGDGDFEEWEMCDQDTYIHAASIQYEDYLGWGRAPGYDDTGVNGLQFKCASFDQEDSGIISYQGQYGRWNEWTEINYGSFISQITYKYDDSEDLDDSGITGIKIKVCEVDGASTEE